VPPENTGFPGGTGISIHIIFVASEKLPRQAFFADAFDAEYQEGRKHQISPEGEFWHGKSQHFPADFSSFTASFENFT